MKVIVPELGEGITKAMVAFWHFKLGDKVTANEDLVELVTDKATFNVPAGKTGVLKQLLVDEGQEATIGQAIAVVE